MSTTPTPPAEPAVPTPAVPYGPPVTASGEAPAAAYVLDLSKRSVAGTAGKSAIRILLPLLIRAIFRAIARR